jgi:serine-type D-Ala-D-Ala carboxypeptidase (penicillin-binding protein 5/6)
MSKGKVHKAARISAGFILAILALLAVVFLFTQPSLAPSFDEGVLGLRAGKEQNNPSQFTAESNSGPIGQGVSATSFLIYKESTGEIIASKNPDTALAIASITKLMTAYVVEKYGNLEDVWAISAGSTENIRPTLGLVLGDRVKIGDLVNAMLIGSANDAATALGAYLTAATDKPMTDLMNQESKNLGMNSTHYANSVGFDSEQNYSTANDLQKLLSRIRTRPLFMAVDRMQSYSFTSELGKHYSIKATNELLAADPEIRAVKTGYTTEAGGAMITAVYHDDLKFIIIVLGSDNRERDTKLLKDQVLMNR